MNDVFYDKMGIVYFILKVHFFYLKRVVIFS